LEVFADVGQFGSFRHGLSNLPIRAFFLNQFRKTSKYLNKKEEGEFPPPSPYLWGCGD
jgi:hypothetical protein